MQSKIQFRTINTVFLLPVFYSDYYTPPETSAIKHELCCKWTYACRAVWFIFIWCNAV